MFLTKVVVEFASIQLVEQESEFLRIQLRSILYCRSPLNLIDYSVALERPGR